MDRYTGFLLVAVLFYGSWTLAILLTTWSHNATAIEVGCGYYHPTTGDFTWKVKQ